MPGIGTKQSSFKRFVEVGRVVLVNSGPYSGKLAVIVEIVDHARALIDGPTTGLPRGVYFYRDLILTPIIMKLPRGAREGKVRKEFEAQKIVEKWESSSWAKSRKARFDRANLNDFGRHEVLVLRRRRAGLINKAIGQASKA